MAEPIGGYWSSSLRGGTNVIISNTMTFQGYSNFIYTKIMEIKCERNINESINSCSLDLIGWITPITSFEISLSYI